jgi:hypothetical protein
MLQKIYDAGDICSAVRRAVPSVATILRERELVGKCGPRDRATHPGSQLFFPDEPLQSWRSAHQNRRFYPPERYRNEVLAF